MASTTTDWTSPGLYDYTIPFAATSATFTVIGGGGSGNKDCDDDDLGGGGGGGGFARSSRNVDPGASFQVRVGNGGAQPSCEQANGGVNSYIVGPITGGGTVTVSAGGGGGGTDNSGGGAGGYEAGDQGGAGQSGNDDDKDGRGGGAGKPGGGNSGRCSGDYNGGRGTTLDGTDGECTGGRKGGNYGGGGGGRPGNNEAGAGANGAARITVTYSAPTIESFTGSTQTSSTGTPSSEVTLTWQTTYANKLTINNSVGDVTSLGVDSSKTFSSGLQSVAGSNSPASRVYRLTAEGPGGSVTADATVYVSNDNTPDGCTSTPTKTTDNTNIDNLAQNTVYILQMGSVTGIDMPMKITTVTTPPNATDLQVSKDGGGWGSEITVNNNDTFQLRFTSPAYNTDPSGLKNPKTLRWQLGSLSSTCSLIVYTRAPDVNEIFDFASDKTFYPYPDIDINPSAALPYMQANISTGVGDVVTVNDVDIPVEFKVDKSSTQARIKRQGSATWGAWDTWT